jgi:uncharacterized membrane protein
MKLIKMIIPILWDEPISKLRWSILIILSSFTFLGFLLAAGISDGSDTVFILLPDIGGQFTGSWRGFVGGVLTGIGVISTINFVELLYRHLKD